MTDDLTKVEETLTLGNLSEQTAISKYSDDAFDSMTKGGWLPRLQLMTANAEKCKKNEFPLNHYALVDGQTFNDLGETVDVLLLGWRPKALEIDDEILTVYNPEDAEFQRIQGRADTEKDSGCMWGFEFLVWIGGIRGFATFFCGSKSARKEAKNIKGMMSKAVTLRSHFIETKKYSWQACQAVLCSTPMDMPSTAAYKAELDKFNNPEVSTVEKVEETSGRAV